MASLRPHLRLRSHLRPAAPAAVPADAKVAPVGPAGLARVQARVEPGPAAAYGRTS